MYNICTIFCMHIYHYPSASWRHGVVLVEPFPGSHAGHAERRRCGRRVRRHLGVRHAAGAAPGRAEPLPGRGQAPEDRRPMVGESCGMDFSGGYVRTYIYIYNICAYTHTHTNTHTPIYNICICVYVWYVYIYICTRLVADMSNRNGWPITISHTCVVFELRRDKSGLHWARHATQQEFPIPHFLILTRHDLTDSARPKWVKFQRPYCNFCKPKDRMSPHKVIFSNMSFQTHWFVQAHRSCQGLFFDTVS